MLFVEHVTMHETYNYVFLHTRNKLNMFFIKMFQLKYVDLRESVHTVQCFMFVFLFLFKLNVIGVISCMLGVYIM